MKRFYETVEVAPSEGGHQILLDGRTVKTPSKALLMLPTVALAEAVADEWRAQGEVINPHGMHLTKLANTATDRVVVRAHVVAAEVAGFGGTDLICYRATHPQALVDRQAQVWDPYVVWAADALGADLVVTHGITHVAQSTETLAAFVAAVDACSAHALTGLHGLTTAFGSLTLGLAHLKGFVAFEAAWDASQLDENFQVEQWGEDAEATAQRKALYADAQAASVFLSHLV